MKQVKKPPGIKTAFLHVIIFLIHEVSPFIVVKESATNGCCAVSPHMNESVVTLHGPKKQAS